VSLEDLANLGEAIGGFAVLVTLVYLALQIRQNTRAVRAATYQQVVDATSDWSATLCQHDDLLLVWTRGTRDGIDSLGEFERTKFSFALLTLLRRVENIHYQELSGTLEPEAWSGIRNSLQRMFKTPGTQNWWRENAFRFTPVFQNYVERELLASL